MSTTTDILDTTIPEPAWVLDPTYDSELNPDLTHSRASAARMVSDEGKYVSRASDVERVPYGFDGDPGLLVEAASRTNHVLNSSNASVWSTRNGGSVGNALQSLIDGENAYPITGDGTVNGQILETAGTFSGSTEVFGIIVEQDTAPVCVLEVKDNTVGSAMIVEFDFSNETFTNKVNALTSPDDTHSRLLTTNGPNGGRVFRLLIRYTVSNSGNNRSVKLYPDDRTSVDDTTIFHHAQIEEAHNASSPIVTQGSPVTRSGDDYAIFEGGQPPWWNPNEGTVILDLSVRAFEADTFENQMHVIGFQDDKFRTSVTLRNGTLGEFNYFLRDDDSADFAKVSKSPNPFGTDSIAFSFTRNERILSVNGTSRVGPSNGKFISTPSMKIGVENRLLGIIRKLIYVPGALPESTLNRITS